MALSACGRSGGVASRLLILAAAASAALHVSTLAVLAQTWPEREIRFISAFPAGSGSDTVMRFIAERMRTLVRVPVVVENKVGASGILAATHVARSRPDGYTIFTHAGNTLATLKHLMKEPPFDPATTMQVAATINRQAFMLVTDARQPWTSVADLTAAMKQKGERASYGASANIGLIMGAIYREHIGVKAVDVQYRSALDAVSDMVAGQIDFALVDSIVAISQAQAGRVRILGVGLAERLRAAPDLPTMAEQGVPIDLPSWFAAVVPVATPKPVVAEINRLFSTVVGMPETRAFLERFGTDPWISSPDEGQARLMTDLEVWPGYIALAKLPLQ